MKHRIWNTKPLLSFEERLSFARWNGKGNCIGTALFLAGMIRQDGIIYSDKAYRQFLVDLPRVNSPELYGLIAWQQALPTSKIVKTPCVWTAHLGLVTSIDPLLVAHRPGLRNFFEEDAPFERPNTVYGSQEGKRNFLRYYQTPLQEEMFTRKHG